MEIVERREIEGTVYDTYRDGVSYRPTGDEVRFEGDDIFWTEYVRSDGTDDELYYFN
jgi:hypothetical protein